jgi:hypothetical protein
MRKLARLVLFAVALSAGWGAVSPAYAGPEPGFEDFQPLTPAETRALAGALDKRFEHLKAAISQAHDGCSYAP